jgi:hypothetical protein
VRTRWAAIGAAVAVTLGGGGLAWVDATSGPASSFVPVSPVRVLDTRTGLGLTGPFSSPTGRNLQLTGSIPTSAGTQQVVPAGATAVVLNVTAVIPQTDGFISVRPAGQAGPPQTSSLNFAAGDVIPNAVTVSMSAGGAVEITYDAFGRPGPTTDVLADITGYYIPGGAGTPGPPGPAGPAGPAGTGPADGTPCSIGGIAGTIVNGFGTNSELLARCFRALTTTLAGNGTAGFLDGTSGPTGTTRFNSPRGVAVDTLGNVYVADTFNHRIRKITPGGIATTLAGNGTFGFVDGTGGPSGTTQFHFPYGVAVDTLGNVYVADTLNHRIRKITPTGDTTTLAGNGGAGFADGTGGPSGTTQFSFAQAVAVDTLGTVYVADTLNHRIRKITPGGDTTTLAGNGTFGFVDGTGGPSGTAQFSAPYGVAVDTAGNVYVADNSNNRIRKISPGGTTTTLSGNGTTGFADGTGGPGGTTRFNSPRGVAVDNAGNVYVADTLNHRIRKISPGGDTSTLTGNGSAGFIDGTGGPGGTTQFSFAWAVAVDNAGNVYVADTANNSIRRIS